MAGRMPPRAETAFQESKGQRRPRERTKDHLAWIASLPCVFNGYKAHRHAAHIRFPSLFHGKRATGMSEKPDDRWTVPLSHDLHLNGPDAQHNSNEKEWWQARGVDVCTLALALWGCSGDTEMAEIVLAEHRSIARLT